MGRLIDITGKKFGRLTVIKRLHVNKNKFIVWECKCDCGKTIHQLSYPLRQGEVKSCGCLNTEMRLERITTHGLSKLPIYKVWKSMKKRCYAESDKRYHRYGGRGIIVCDEWLKSPESFIRWAISNGYKEGLTIDRIDNDDNYLPNNCRFVTIAKNNRNSSNTHLTETNIKEIRSLHSSGMMQIDIAPLFGISQQSVSKIVNNKTWRDE